MRHTGRRALRSVWVYALFQVPGGLLAGVVLWLLFHWGWISLGWALGLFLGWVVKDCVLYPVLRDAFTPPLAGDNLLVGARGMVEKALCPHGLVRLGGELWKAEPVPPERAIAAGTSVVVRATSGLTLLVQAEDTASPSSELRSRG